MKLCHQNSVFTTAICAIVFAIGPASSAVFRPVETAGAEERKTFCGGTYAEQHGVISTPNFPDSFPAPIECKWIFRGAPGDHITLYLTQFYLKEGVNAAAYGFYSDDNIFMAKDDLGAVQAEAGVSYISTRKPVLVLSLNLISNENVNIRVKDRFLDVFGFNITYEMRRPRTGTSLSCSAFGCAFNGHCLASPSFRSYACQCFPGFFGANCQFGPGCDPDRNVEVCQNGGKCSYVAGSTGIQCTCPPGFTGTRCETMYLDGLQKQCETMGMRCSQICKMVPDGVPKCSCHKGFELANDKYSCKETGVTRYVASLKVQNLHIDPVRVNLSSGDYSELKRKVEKPLAQFLQSRLSRRVRLEITSFLPGAIVEFRFLALNGESGVARDALAEIVNNGSLEADLKFDSHFIRFEREPTLSLQKVDMDVPSPAETGWNMTLTCIATGSRDLKFQWYKDGSKVVVSRAMRPCKEILWPRNSKNQYTTQLVIGNIQRVDGGVFTCRVTDWSGSQERSILVKVQTPPEVILEPAGEITVLKGSNFSVTCSTKDVTGQNGYTWMKNGQLVSDEPELVTEDLYPDGSRIYVQKLHSRIKLTCMATNSAGSSSTSVSVTPMDPEDDSDVCLKQEAYGIQWPVTTRGQVSLRPCPTHYSGHSKRSCDFEEVDRKPIWSSPDFDDCHSSVVKSVKNKLEALRYGYEVINPSEIPDELLRDLARRAPVLPQSGVDALDIIRDASDYMISLSTESDLRESIEDFGHAFSFLLSNTTVLPTKWISTAVDVMQRHFLALRLKEPDKHVIHRGNYAVYSSIFREPEQVFPFGNSQESSVWAIRERVRVAMEKNAFPLVDADEVLEVSAIFFRNISQFLPRVYSERLDVTQLEKEYELISQAVSVSLQKDNSNSISKMNGVMVEVEFPLLDERLNLSAWVPVCGHGRSLGPSQTVSLRWEPFACEATIKNSSSIVCSCKQFGMFALLLTASDVQEMNNEWGFYAEVMVGCSLAAVLLTTSLFFLVLQWIRLSDTMGLSKAQEVFASAAATGLIMMSARTSLPQDMYPYIITGLTFAFNLIISSQFCRPIFVYVEYNMPSTLRGHRLKITILSWGLPCVTTTAAMAAQEMEGWDLESWWLVQDTMFFYGAAVPFFILLVLYFWMYFLAMASIRRKLVEAERDDTVDQKTYERLFRRAHREHSLLQRSSLVVWTTMILFIASIYFVNDEESGAKTYFLGFTVVLHALANWAFYIHKNEYRIPLWKILFDVQQFYAAPPVEIDNHEEPEQEPEEKPEKDHRSRAGSSSKSKASTSSTRTRGGSVETLPMEELNQLHLQHDEDKRHGPHSRMNGIVKMVGVIDVHC